MAEYAKVQKDCYLFRTSDITDKSFQNVFFVVPETYFVKIIEKTLTVYKVQYQDEVGFVAPETVKIVDFVPSVPELLDVTFDLKSKVSTQIRETPSISASNIKTIIPEGERGLSYIASTVGERPLNGVSNIWFYAYYFPKSDPTRVYKGYIYEGATENLSSIDVNGEDVEVVEPPAVETNTDIDYSVNPTIKTILIILICLPIFLVFVLLLVGNRKTKNGDPKELLDDEVKTQKVPKEKPKKQTAKKFVDSKLKKIDDFEGQTFERKHYYTNFLEKPTSTANLKPEFPTYEVIDDDDLL